MGVVVTYSDMSLYFQFILKKKSLYNTLHELHSEM